MICRKRSMRSRYLRSGPLRAIPSTVVAGLVLLGTASTADAQQPDRSARAQVVHEAERGWIGVSFNMSADGGGWADAVLITDVSAGSPAAEAGLRPGDHVVAINRLDTPQELAALPELLRLRAGDPVVMVVERDGDRRRFQMRAAPRPADFRPERSVRVAVSADSVVESWTRSIDSLRVRLRTVEGGAAVTGGGQDVSIRRVQGRGEEGSRLTVIGGGLGHGVRIPFEFFVFRGEAHDSLRQEMAQLNSLTVSLETRIQARERQLGARPGSEASGEAARDVELRRLQAQLQQVASRSSRLEAAMAEAARENAGLEYDVVAPEPTAASAAAPTSSGEFRPLTPYLLGRNRVAGAEVIDLEPELARYFDVTGGVLITRVAEGTPASISGLLPGDVVTRIDRVAIRSVEDLRVAVSVADDAVPVTLIREGQSRQILLGKR
jgi:membrane-associated protease RseP (regulator of RpoE activity)